MRRGPAVAAALAVQAVLAVVAVAPQLSARLTGEEYRLAVAPVDPVDPFRGAYVALALAGLPAAPERSGTVFVPLVPDGDVWRGTTPEAQRPASGPYLRCEAAGRLRCGVDSLFVPQREARRIEAELAAGAVAVVRVDRRGNAALVGLRES